MGKTSKELKLSMSLAEWLSRYTKDELVEIVFELEFLQKLMLPENQYGIVSINHDALLPLTKMGGIISCPHPLGKDYAIYMMLDEVREYFEPHVAKYITRKKKLGFDRLEQLAMGTLNLFGGMTAKALIGYVEGIADRSDQRTGGADDRPHVTDRRKGRGG